MKAFTLPPLYLRGGRTALQEPFAAWVHSAGPGAVLLVHAPTGAGKTHAVIRSAPNGRNPFDQTMLVMTPTNALAAQIVQDLEHAGVQRVQRWTADDLKAEGGTRHERMMQHTREKSVVVTNPDILHLFTQHQYLWAGARKRLAEDGVKHFGLHVFDEYHAYDERILASVLLYVVKGRRLGLAHRYVFLSATPEPALEQALAALGIEHQTIQVEATADGRDEMIKGPIGVTVSNGPILDSLPERVGARTLFLFNTFLDEQRAVQVLLSKGWKRNVDFVEMTGRDTRSSAGQQDISEGAVILATSKADLGLNIECLDRLVMEPGWSDQQFWQRLGRAGRGRAADVVLHFNGYDARTLAGLDGASYDSLAKSLRGLLASRYFHHDTMYRYLGAYAASYVQRTPPSVTRDLAVDHETLPASSRSFYAMTQAVLSTSGESYARDEEGMAGGALHWRKKISTALGRLRGQGMKVAAHYSYREETDVVEEDLLWLLRWTNARAPDFHVDEYHNKQNDVMVSYTVLDRPIVLRLNSHDEQRRVLKDLSARMGGIVAGEYAGDVPELWNHITRWLQLAKPDDISPDEAIDDDPFL